MNSQRTQNEKSGRDWEKMAAGWRKWHNKFASQSFAATKTILEMAQVEQGMTILDLACGSGEPSLSLARAVGPKGHVVATDIVPEMIQIARENSVSEHLTNMEFKVAEAESIPFPDNSFDVVTCRFGLMFFANAHRAMQEARRVLKDNGAISLVTWGPLEKNPRFTSTTSIIQKYRSGLNSPVQSNENDLFKFGEIGSLSKLLKECDFGRVSEKQITIPWIWNGSVEEQFSSFSEMSAPFQQLSSTLSRDLQEKIISEILTAIGLYYDGSRVNFTAVINATSAKK